MPDVVNFVPTSPVFGGFRPGETGTTRLPDSFFSELLPLIDDLAEFKVTLYCFWAVQQRLEAHFYLRHSELISDRRLLASVADGIDITNTVSRLEAALTKAVARGTLITAALLTTQGDEALYFVNTARGREAQAAFVAQQWAPDPGDPIITLPDSPNIFKLYEVHFGPLTPILADKLRDTELTYPFEWIEAAVQSAVERNMRHWQYVENVLKRWQTEGPPDGLVRANSKRNQDTQSAYGLFWGDQ
jgi:DnaD/phage-associated family protein